MMWWQEILVVIAFSAVCAQVTTKSHFKFCSRKYGIRLLIWVCRAALTMTIPRLVPVQVLFKWKQQVVWCDAIAIAEDEVLVFVLPSPGAAPCLDYRTILSSMGLLNMSIEEN